MQKCAETAPKCAGLLLYNERTVWDRERYDLGVTPEDDARRMMCVKQRHIEEVPCRASLPTGRTREGRANTHEESRMRFRIDRPDRLPTSC